MGWCLQEAPKTGSCMLKMGTTAPMGWLAIVSSFCVGLLVSQSCLTRMPNTGQAWNPEIENPPKEFH